MGVTQSLTRRLTTMNAVSIWLLPLYVLYRLGWWVHYVARHVFAGPPLRAQAKVISVGSVEWGGSAKTSLAIELARYLVSRGKRVAVLSRGYGRSTAGAQKVNPSRPDASMRYGDEPVLIARDVPDAVVWVGADRAAAAAAVEAQGSIDAIVLDDGLDVGNLRKDLDIVAMDPETLRPPVWLRDFYLRFPLRRAAHARVKIWVGQPPAPGGGSDSAFCVRYQLQGFTDLSTGLPVATEALLGSPAIAFCGLARSERFVDTLRAAGISVSETVCFPDHHPYRASDIRRLLSAASRIGVQTLLTTPKDAVRLEPLLNLFRGGASIAPIRFLIARAELVWTPDRSVLEAAVDALWKS